MDRRKRFLHLVRHGQYRAAPDVFGGTLTDVGKVQASFLAEALGEIPLEAIHSSDMNRAIETARIICQARQASFKEDALIRELVPTRVKSMPLPRERLQDSRERLAQIEQTYLRRTNRLRHELLVCHGNLIRGLVARALGAPKRAWMKMDIHLCSITTLCVCWDHSIRLVRFNESGHIPLEIRLSH